MKKLLMTLSLFASLSAAAQHQFIGFRSGNFTGVNGVFFNPANVADSRYRWDVNLFGANAGVGNNNASFSLDNLGDAFGDSASNALFNGNGGYSSGLINADVLGPSFMFNVSKKLSFAITSRVRVLANVQDIDGNLIDAINDERSNSFPFSINSAANQRLSVNGWTDLGVTAGMVLKEEGNHFLKAGLTVKYLSGAANSFVNINNLKGTIDEDLLGEPYLSNTTGGVAIGYSGVDLDNFEASDAFKANGSGVGFDLGFVYEYRPDGSGTSANQNKYKYKLGIALLDAGSIKYTPDPNEFGNYTLNITGSERFFPAELQDKSVSEIKTYLDSKPSFFTNNSASLTSYKSKLPTTLQINADYHIKRGLYIDLSSQVSLAQKDNLYSSYYNNQVTLTPRFESKVFGVYLPLNYSSLTKFNAGISLRAGPLFLGSGSVLTALLGESKQADFHFGIRFGSLKKKGKASKGEI